MNNQQKVLLPDDVRKLLNIDNKEIVELCKQTSVSPKKNEKGQIYFSIEEVKKLKNAKSSILTGLSDKKSALSVVSKPNSQMVVNNLIDTLSKMENNITTSMTKLIDEKLEGMDDVVLELVRCKTENETLKNTIKWKKFIDIMGGTIEVYSKLNEGTKFVVTLDFEIDTSVKEEKKNFEEFLNAINNFNQAYKNYILLF